MNILMSGLTFGSRGADIGVFRSRKGHALRFLSAEGDGDYQFHADESACGVLTRISGEWPVDVYVCWTPELFPPPREVEYAVVKTAAVVSDWNVYHPQLECNLARYDVVLTDKRGAAELDLVGATPRYYFPLYSQCSRLHRKLDTKRDIDILFAGNLNHAVHVTRGRLLEQVASLSDRHNVVITTGHLGEDYVCLINRARIVFNYSLRGEMNLRCFEALACGALLFLEEDNLEVREYLADREEVVLYRQDNLRELLEHYLAQPDEQARIADAGHARSAELAMENRFDALFEWIAAQPLAPRRFKELPEERRLLADVTQYASSLVPAQQVLAHGLLGKALARHPDSLELAMAAGCHALDAAKADPKPALQEALARFQAVSKARPGAITPWLNLAFVCRLAGLVEAEAAYLGQAIDAADGSFHGLLLGRLDDPYYHAWRRACAVGRFRPETLWASAATRQAEIFLASEEYGRAAESAERSIQWRPEVSAPYRIAGLAREALGDVPGAVCWFEQGLSRTAFDAVYRMDLIRLLRKNGRPNDARALAEASAKIFNACDGQADTADTFRAEARF